MGKDKWLTSYQAAFELALRSTPDPIDPKAPAAAKRRDRAVMNAFYHRVERGTVPQPCARLPKGELRFSEREIIEYKAKLEQEEKERRGRNRKGRAA